MFSNFAILCLCHVRYPCIKNSLKNLINDCLCEYSRNQAYHFMVIFRHNNPSVLWQINNSRLFEKSRKVIHSETMTKWLFVCPLSFDLFRMSLGSKNDTQCIHNRLMNFIIFCMNPKLWNSSFSWFLNVFIYAIIWWLFLSFICVEWIEWYSWEFVRSESLLAAPCHCTYHINNKEENEQWMSQI